MLFHIKGKRANTQAIVGLRYPAEDDFELLTLQLLPAECKAPKRLMTLHQAYTVLRTDPQASCVRGKLSTPELPP